jgi:SAM-dependent methyltransferase
MNDSYASWRRGQGQIANGRQPQWPFGRPKVSAIATALAFICRRCHCAFVSAQWYENFFYGIANELWDKCMPPETTKAEAEFIAAELGCTSGAHLLDIPCGNGRHCRELASRGYRMTGFDISREYIEKAKALSPKLEWICDNMRDLSAIAKFGGAYCFGNAFGYLEHEDTVRFLAALSRALKPGGRFVLQSAAAEVVLPRFKEREWYEIGDMVFAEVNEYSAARSCIETKFTFIRDGKTETRPGRQFIYTAAEVQRMVAGAGLRIVNTYGGVDRKPFALGLEMLYVVAEKG